MREGIIIADSQSIYCNEKRCVLYKECLELQFWDRENVTKEGYKKECKECDFLFPEQCEYAYCIKKENRIKFPSCPYPEYTTFESYEEYLKSELWRLISYEYKKAAGFKCEKCDSKINLQVHHYTYDHVGEEYGHGHQDCIVLCRQCHEREHDL
jgi:hypothetical protein